jgi:peroxiredoxin
MATFCSLHSRSFLFACAALMTIGWLTVVAAARADELPRYKLKVGQEIVYRTTDPPQESDDGAGGKQSNHRVMEWIVDVVSRDADGSWWLVFRQKITATYEHQGKKSKQELQSDGHFRITADGKFVENASIRPLGDPTSLFPTLPPDAAGLKNGWQDSLTLDETLRQFHVAAEAAPDGGNEWRFVAQPRSALDPIYDLSTACDYVFDRAAGLVRKIVTTRRYGWPASLAAAPQVQTIELGEVRQLDASDAAAIAQQAKNYFAAIEEYERTTDRARHEFAHTATQFINAEATLKEACDKLTLPWLRETLDARLQQHKREMEFAVQDAVQFAKLVNRPSEDWQTTDLDGKPRGLADYSGKVVVLDFWYRGCGWCIRAMPQMKQLTDDFAGQEVAILGINSDSELDDARFVVDRLKLNYPTLKNGDGEAGINMKYKIHGWPTLVVIDKKGVVRHIHFGYSPTLRSELGDMIRSLLAEPAG